MRTFWAGLSRKAKIYIVAGAAGVLLLIIIIASCSGGGGSSASGYNNINTLQTALTQASSWNPGDAVPISASCVHQAGTQYNCTMTYAGGSSRAWVVTVTPNGKSFEGAH